MKYSLVHATYDYDTNDIHIFCRDENYKKVVKVIHGFEPYGYVSTEDYKSIAHHHEITSAIETNIPFINDKNKQMRFTTSSPKFVGEIRKTSEFPIHEADIPFPRRFMIDHEIFCGFECDQSRSIVHPDDLTPVQFIQPPKKVYFDIETSIEEDLITIISFYEPTYNKYLSVVIDPDGHEKHEKFADDHEIFYTRDEKSLIAFTQKILKKLNPDILTAWYVDFDIGELKRKVRKYTRSDLDTSAYNIFDMLEPYKKLYNKGSNKLKDVIPAENLDLPEYEPYKQTYWRGDLKKGILLNKSHTKAIYILDKKLEILDTFWNYKSIAGFENMSPTIYHGSIVDIRLLRKYNGKFILPSKPSGNTVRERNAQMDVEKIGGKVFKPPFGLFHNIAFYDMSRYYPELIIGQNLTFEKDTNGELGLFPEMALELIEERLVYDRRLDELDPGTNEHKQAKYLRDSIKFVLNSIFGYCGWGGARLFRLDIFNGITMKGQEGLMFVQSKSSKDGKDLIYGDTDSTALRMPSNDEAKEHVKDKSITKNLKENKLEKGNEHAVAHALEYTDKLNEYLVDFCNENNFTRPLELKLDRFFSDILFKKVRERVGGQWVERGAKKRYVGWVIWEKRPTKYLKIVGFEYVRKDASKETKHIQPEVFKRILAGDLESVSEFIKESVTRIRDDFNSGSLSPTHIAIPTTLSKNPWEYGGKNKNGRKLTPPDYVRGSIYANEWLGEDIRASDQIHMVYVKRLRSYPPTEVISYTDESNLPEDLIIDIEKHIERTIKMPIEKVIDSVDLTWKEIFTPNNTLW